MIDYHLHSERSHDANGSIMDICRAALANGLEEICFTEHVDFEPSDDCYGYFDYDLCNSQIREAKSAFAGKLEIRFGAEIDFQEKYKSDIRDFLDGKAFDYVIGAAHYVGGVLMERHTSYFPGKSAAEAYAPYFETTLRAVECGLFDTIAHLDLCKRHGVKYYGVFDTEPFAPMIDRVLKGIISRNMSLEINTSGLRQAAKDFYPCESILQSYYTLGGRNITIGSDSHSADTVGSGVNDALSVARSAGFTEIGTYRSRQRIGKAI